MDISRLTNDELLARAKLLARAERGAVCNLVEHLAEIDRRRLHETLGYPSIFDYCVRCLGCSEGAAFRRIRAARAIRIFPPISVLIRDGRLSLESVALLHPFLKDPDAAELIRQAAGATTRKVQALLAGRCEEAPGHDVIRFRGPARRPTIAPRESEGPRLTFAPPPCAPTEPAAADDAPRPPVLGPPQAPGLRSIRVAFTADEGFYDLLLRARRLLRHKYPDGRLEGILRDALLSLIEKKDRRFGRR